MKLVAIAVAILSLLVAACAEDDESVNGVTPATSPTPTAAETPTPPPPSPTPTPEPSPTVMPVDCPVTPGGVCEFALELHEAVRAGDIDSLVELGEPVEVTCTEELPQLDPRAPLCRDAEAGETRTGYSVARLQSEGAIVDRESLRQTLSDWLAERTAPVELTTIGCDAEGAEGLDCSERFGVVFAGEDDLLLLIAETPEDPRISLYVTGVTAINQELISGGTTFFSLDFDPESPPARFIPFEP